VQSASAPLVFWLGTLALLAEVAAAVEERRAARLLYDALLPYAGRVVVVGMSAGCLGSASRALALLAASLGRHDRAESHFDAALEENARLGALPLLARTSEECAAWLRLRARSGDGERAEKLEDEAAGLRRELAFAEGSAQRGGEAAGAVVREPPAEAAVEAALERVPAGWAVRYGGAELRLRDGRGLRYLALLVAEPERERHVLDLVGGGEGEAPPRERVQGLDEVIDRQARGEYRARLAELRADLEHATAAGDLGYAERARGEIEAIEHALAGAFGLSGRARRLGDPVERARKAVYNRLRDAIASIEAEIPVLGRHLACSIRTGTYCAYRPDRPIRWLVVDTKR
jgi:tetratricopeptide (TPR) repeat protein